MFWLLCGLCADIVFLRSWYPVSIPQLYNAVTSLLLPVGQKDNWVGMRTLGQLKHDLGIRNKPNKDSLYKVEKAGHTPSHLITGVLKVSFFIFSISGALCLLQCSTLTTFSFLGNIQPSGTMNS